MTKCCFFGYGCKNIISGYGNNPFPLMSRWEGSSPAKCCNDCNSLVMKARVEGVMKERAKAEGKVDKYEGYEDWFQTAEETDLCCRAGTFAWEEWKHRQLADRAEGDFSRDFRPHTPPQE